MAAAAATAQGGLACLVNTCRTAYASPQYWSCIRLLFFLLDFTDLPGGHTPFRDFTAQFSKIHQHVCIIHSSSLQYEYIFTAWMTEMCNYSNL